MQSESEVEIEHMSFCVSKVRFGRLSLFSLGPSGTSDSDWIVTVTAGEHCPPQVLGAGEPASRGDG